MQHPFDGIIVPDQSGAEQDTGRPTRRSLFKVLAGAVAGLFAFASGARAQQARKGVLSLALGEAGGNTLSRAFAEEAGDPTKDPTKMRREEGAPLPSTEAVGEEGGATTKALNEEGGVTTKALNEEGGKLTRARNEDGGPRLTTLALGEEGGRRDQPQTKALGEEGKRPPLRILTNAVGEDGAGQLTTQAVGEEG
jgi:hypothetical protein